MDTRTQSTLDIIERFNQAVNQHDLDLTMALMTSDCVFENTYPAPDGERFTGQPAVRGFGKTFLSHHQTRTLNLKKLLPARHAPLCAGYTVGKAMREIRVIFAVWISFL